MSQLQTPSHPLISRFRIRSSSLHRTVRPQSLLNFVVPTMLSQRPVRGTPKEVRTADLLTGPTLARHALALAASQVRINDTPMLTGPPQPVMMVTGRLAITTVCSAARTVVRVLTALNNNTTNNNDNRSAMIFRAVRRLGGMEQMKGRIILELGRDETEG